MPSLSRCRDTVALAFLLCSSLLAQNFDATFVEEMYPGGDGAEGERWINVRVVARLSGEPIHNAELLLIKEASAPIGGEPIRAWREVSDDDGFLSVQVDKSNVEYEPWNWLCVRAPGYCQHMEMSGMDDVVIGLSPSVAVPLQVRDWRDLPVAGALVGFCKGCGHTPDLVHGITGSDGLVTLPDVDVLKGIADFYVVHPDLTLGYDSPTWYPSKQPIVMRLRPGLAHRGMVVDHKGVPVYRAAVGMSEVHRGPWALTKADGTFEVSGLDSATDLYVEHNGRKVIFACAGTEGLRLQLPKQVDNQTVVVEMPEDVYELNELRREQLQELREKREAAWPKVLVRTVGMPENGSVELHTKRKRYEIDDQISLGKPVAIPDEEFVFELTGDDRCKRIIVGDREQALRDGMVRLTWYPDTIIEGRIVDEDGAPLHAAVRIEALHSDPGKPDILVQSDFEGAISLPVKLQGMHLLVVRERYSGATRSMPIELPPRGENVFVDVGTVTIRERSPLTVRGPDGKELEEGDVHLHRLGFRTWHFERSNGQWWGPDLVAGDYIVLASDVAPPKGLDVDHIIDVSSRIKIEGAGPWTIQQHAGEMLIDIDADGARVGVTIGEHCLSTQEPMLVRGLQPGMHHVFISAPGRQSAIVDIEVPAIGEGRANLKLALPQAK